MRKATGGKDYFARMPPSLVPSSAMECIEHAPRLTTSHPVDVEEFEARSALQTASDALRTRVMKPDHPATNPCSRLTAAFNASRS